MKICPRCQKTYADDNLNFCLEDGSVLAAAPVDPQQTIPMNQPLPPLPQPQIPSPPSAQAGWNTPQQSPKQPPKKSSKAWVWVLLILGMLMFLCVGGGALIYVFRDEIEKAVANSSQPPSNDRRTPTPTENQGTNSSTTTSTTTSTSTSGRDDLETIDLSALAQDFSMYGTTEVMDGEFIMSSRQKRYYFVVVAPDQYTTDDADTRVTLRNIENASGSLGYGLIFHSNPTPLQQGYAFLIDTKRKKYRVVHHEPQKESSVVSWTASTAIKEGTEENVLEARDLDDKIELYINGTMVTSIKNVYGYSGGVPGIYSGDGVKIAFKNLEIRK